MNLTAVPAPGAAFDDDHVTVFPVGDDHATAVTGCPRPGARQRAGPPGRPRGGRRV
ncbi:hypothetical protein [Streptomyces sp. NPDC051162]|uniref:hypothetical protein n=1 Tax=unclassified Streptomyces TaxID=2593676 RepID=UPI0034128107